MYTFTTHRTIAAMVKDAIMVVRSLKGTADETNVGNAD